MTLITTEAELRQVLGQPARTTPLKIQSEVSKAEHLLRPAVVSQKLGGCNKTDVGAETQSILSSILVTARRLGHSLVELAVGWLRRGQAEALPP